MNIRIRFQGLGRHDDSIILNPFLTVKEAKKKIVDKFGFVQDEYRLIYNAKNLNDDLTLNDSGLTNNSFVFLIPKNNGPKGGGCGINVVDLSKNQTRILNFAPNAPFYRRVTNGLNIYAICSNSSCNAYNKGIYCPIGFVYYYNILKNLEEIKCPACNEEVYPKNFGFLNCNYKIEYIAFKDNSKLEGKVEGEAGEKFKIFDEDSGNANFTKLIFTITKN